MGEFSRASACRRRAALLAACAGCALPVWATPKSYIGPNNGLWSTGGNWTPAGQPIANDDVTVLAGTNKTVIYDAAATTGILSSLTIDGSAGTIILSIATNTLSANNIYVGKTLTGRLDQSGGTVSLSNIVSQLILGNDAGSNGTYNLSGGLLNSSYFEIIGSSGTGTFSQTGGSNTANTLALASQNGSKGFYNLSAGTLTAQYISVGAGATSIANASFVQTGGAANVTGASGLVIGGGGAGGNYSLFNSGSLTVSQSEFVGSSTAGTFSQGGGTHNVNGSGTNALFIGYNFSASGTMNLSGGTLNTANTVVGNNGHGNFNRTGGAHNVSGALTIAKNFLSAGSYSFSGGTLAANTIQLNAGGVFTTGSPDSDALKFPIQPDRRTVHRRQHLPLLHRRLQ